MLSRDNLWVVPKIGYGSLFCCWTGEQWMHNTTRSLNNQEYKTMYDISFFKCFVIAPKNPLPGCYTFSITFLYCNSHFKTSKHSAFCNKLSNAPVYMHIYTWINFWMKHLISLLGSVKLTNICRYLRDNHGWYDSS